MFFCLCDFQLGFLALWRKDTQIIDNGPALSSTQTRVQKEDPVLTESWFHLADLFIFCSLLAGLVCVYPTSLICQHSVSLNVGSRSFHVNIMKAAAVHHLLPSQQQQANTFVSKNDRYSGTILSLQVMEGPGPPKTLLRRSCVPAP